MNISFLFVLKKYIDYILIYKNIIWNKQNLSPMIFENLTRFINNLKGNFGMDGEPAFLAWSRKVILEYLIFWRKKKND